MQTSLISRFSATSADNDESTIPPMSVATATFLFDKENNLKNERNSNYNMYLIYF